LTDQLDDETIYGSDCSALLSAWAHATSPMKLLVDTIVEAHGVRSTQHQEAAHAAVEVSTRIMWGLCSMSPDLFVQGFAERKKPITVILPSLQRMPATVAQMQRAIDENDREIEQMKEGRNSND
jgi:hypothetical protein